LLVNDISHVETLEYRLSLRLFRGTLNSSKAERNSEPHCEGEISDRKEVGFNSSSDIIDTHNFNIQEVLETCMYM